ncbi:MAG: rhomboid family intramembrane serine protease [Aldersonia sp.]|nr:rhomboid family intramembrane serine protease [Aldersonia sp.]
MATNQGGSAPFGESGSPSFDRSRLDAVRARLDQPSAARPPAARPAPEPSQRQSRREPARAEREAPARRPQWRSAAAIIGSFAAMLYLVEFVDVLTDRRLDQWGIQPLSLDGLWGILFAPLLHGDWAHLVANTIPLLILGFLTLLSGLARGLVATAIVWLVAGIGTWLLGGQGTTHIGASGLIFGWLAYLIVRGFFTRSIGQIVLGLVVFLVYGGMLWGLLPGTTGVSWQGHLFGAVGGVVAAWALSSAERGARRGTQRRQIAAR